jgi:hypothetical protein
MKITPFHLTLITLLIIAAIIAWICHSSGTPSVSQGVSEVQNTLGFILFFSSLAFAAWKHMEEDIKGRDKWLGCLSFALVFWLPSLWTVLALVVVLSGLEVKHRFIGEN